MKNYNIGERPWEVRKEFEPPAATQYKLLRSKSTWRPNIRPSCIQWQCGPLTIMNGALSHTHQEVKPGRPHSRSSQDKTVTSRTEPEGHAGHKQAPRVQAPLAVISLKRAPPLSSNGGWWWVPARPLKEGGNPKHGLWIRGE